MVDGIFSSQIGEDELSTLAQSQIKEGSEDSQQIIKTLAVINYLKITVLVIIGFILVQQIYFRLFARGNTPGNGKNGRRAQNNRQKGQRPITRAETLLVMLETNGCPPEQLQTLRNTVSNQDVTHMAPEDFTVEQKKRHDRRERISRPKKSINFNLDNNMVREFRITDIVQRDDTVIKSAERNTPKTAGRLVKLNDGKKDEDNQQSDDDVSVANTEATNAQNEGAPAQPQDANDQAQQENTNDNEEQNDSQSGDGSNQDERETGEEDQSSVMPTLSEINIESQVSNVSESTEETKTQSKGSKNKNKNKNKKKKAQFEKESKVNEAPSSTDDDSVQTKQVTKTKSK